MLPGKLAMAETGCKVGAAESAEAALLFNLLLSSFLATWVVDQPWRVASEENPEEIPPRATLRFGC
jgi:hypothetical protein